MILLLLLPSSFVVAETEPPKAEKIDVLPALQKLQDELSYEVYGASPALDQAVYDFTQPAPGVHDIMFEIFQKKFADYGIPAEWVAGAKNWIDVQKNFQKSVLGPLPPGMTEGSRYALPYRIEPLMTRHEYHAWVIRRSAWTVEEQGFAWSDDLEEMAHGVKEFKESEKEYLEILRIGAQQGNVMWHNLVEQFINQGCNSSDFRRKISYPAAPDLEPAGEYRCAEGDTPACREACRAISRQWLRMAHEFSKTLDRLMKLEYKKFFFILGENMKGQLPSRTEGDKP